VRRSSGRVRVVAALIDAETGNHIWAERYDRALEDVFAAQDEITMAVVAAIAGVAVQFSSRWLRCRDIRSECVQPRSRATQRDR
jgi:hypothetical protein